jgi:RNA polymerase sigma-70 factor (ECF subfamily)
MSLTDYQLIINAQKGDMSSFEELVYRYDRHVMNIAKSFRNSEEDAKDIYQEVFMRVFRGLKNFQFKSEFTTWLFRITTNVCLTFQSRKKNHDSLDREISLGDDNTTTLAENISDYSSADEMIINSEISKYIQLALNDLPPKQKMVFTLKYYEEYKIRQIAEMMQCSEGAVKRYLFVATHKMRDKLKTVLREER